MPADRRTVRGPGAALLEWFAAEFELSHLEQELADAAAASLNHVQELRRQLEADGPVVQGSKGQPRAHPALREIRAELETFRRLVRDLDLPAGDLEPDRLRAMR